MLIVSLLEQYNVGTWSDATGWDTGWNLTTGQSMTITIDIDLPAEYSDKENGDLMVVGYYCVCTQNGAFQELILVDGQQRITTILLLMCALRDISDDKDLKEDIDELYLRNRRAIEDYRIRLKQTVVDNDGFTAIIDGIDPQDTLCNTVKNYRFFLKMLRECSKNHIAVLDAIARMQLVDVNLQVSDNSIGNLRMVQTIFEKINSTGKPLSQADLIRNYLLIAPSVEKQEKWHKDYWLNIEKNLGADNISTFAYATNTI
jgi:uncharacterized protein with ParB-like and HNH nuclease domain